MGKRVLRLLRIVIYNAFVLAAAKGIHTPLRLIVT